MDDENIIDGFPRLPMPAAIAAAAEQVGTAAAAIAKTADAATRLLRQVSASLSNLQELLP
jgi:hypothetical protein